MSSGETKTMAEVLEETDSQWCDEVGCATSAEWAQYMAAALSAAGYGLVADAKREAWDEGAHAALIEEGYIVTAHADIYKINPYRSKNMTPIDQLEQDIRDIPVTVISGPPVDLSGVLAKHLHDLGYRKANNDDQSD